MSRPRKQKLREMCVLYQGIKYSVCVKLQDTVAGLKAALAKQLQVSEGILIYEGKRLRKHVQTARIAGLVELLVCSEPFVWLVTGAQEICVRLQSMEVELCQVPEFRELRLFRKDKALEGSVSGVSRGARVFGVRDEELLVRIHTSWKCYSLVAQCLWTIEDLKQVLSAETGVNIWEQQLVLGTQTLLNHVQLSDLDLTEGLRLVCRGDTFVFIYASQKRVGAVHMAGHCAEQLIEQAALLLNTTASSVLLVHKRRPIAPLKSFHFYLLAVGDHIDAYTAKDKVVHGMYCDGDRRCGRMAATVAGLRSELGLNSSDLLIFQGRVLEEAEPLQLPAGCLLDIARASETLYPVLYASGQRQIAILYKQEQHTVADIKHWVSRRFKTNEHGLRLCRTGRVLTDKEAVHHNDVLEVLRNNEVLVRVNSVQDGDISVCINESALVAELKEKIRQRTGILAANQRLHSYTWLEDKERLDFYGIIGEAQVYLRLPDDQLLNAYVDAKSRPLLVLATSDTLISNVKKQVAERMDCMETLRLALEGVELQDERRVGDYGLGDDSRIEVVLKRNRVIRLQSSTEETLLIKIPAKCESLAALQALIETKTGISASDQRLLWSGSLQSSHTFQDYQMTYETSVSIIRQPRCLDDVRISLKAENKRKFSVKISLSSPVSLLRKLGRTKRKVDPAVLFIDEDVVLQDSKSLRFYGLKANDTVKIADSAQKVICVQGFEWEDCWMWLVRKETTIEMLKTRIVKYPASIQVLSLAEKPLPNETLVGDLDSNHLHLSLQPDTILLLQNKQLPTVLCPGPVLTFENLQSLVEQRTGIRREEQRLYLRDQRVVDMAPFCKLSESGVALHLSSIRTDIYLQVQTPSGAFFSFPASQSDSIETVKKTIGERVGQNPVGLDLIYSMELREGIVDMLLQVLEEKQMELKVRRGAVWVLVYKGVRIVRVEEGETLEQVRQRIQTLCGKTDLQLWHKGQLVESTDLPMLALIQAC